MPEFDYKQRKTTDNHRKGWERVYSSTEPKICASSNYGFNIERPKTDIEPIKVHVNTDKKINCIIEVNDNW